MQPEPQKCAFFTPVLCLLHDAGPQCTAPGSLLNTLWLNPGICISHKAPGDADVPGPDSTLWEPMYCYIAFVHGDLVQEMEMLTGAFWENPCA